MEQIELHVSTVHDIEGLNGVLLTISAESIFIGKLIQLERHVESVPAFLRSLPVSVFLCWDVGECPVSPAFQVSIADKV